MNFDMIVREGIDKIYSGEELEKQKKFLKIIAEDVRGVSDITPLLEAKAFFVPYSGYLAEFFSPVCKDPRWDIYDSSGHCHWDCYLVFPVYDVTGIIRGFAGYNTIRPLKIKDGDESAITLPKYRYSSDAVFNRGNYLYMLPGEYDRALEEGYVILADGLMDKLYLNAAGFISASLMGSYVNDILLFQLKFIDRKVLAEDNDHAGRELYKKLKTKLPDLLYARQNIMSDADDMLKSGFRQQYINTLENILHKKVSSVLRLKPEKSNIV